VTVRVAVGSDHAGFALKSHFVGVLVSLGHDVTERKRLESKLLQADRLGVLGTLAAGMALALSQLVGGRPALAIAMFSIALMGIMSYYPPYWALPTRLLGARSAAAGFGFINLIANFGGFAGPYMVGFLTDRTGGYAAGVYFMMSTAVLASLVLMFLREK